MVGFLLFSGGYSQAFIVGKLNVFMGGINSAYAAGNGLLITAWAVEKVGVMGFDPFCKIRPHTGYPLNKNGHECRSSCCRS
jgi:hypothetical protein